MQPSQGTRGIKGLESGRGKGVQEDEEGGDPGVRCNYECSYGKGKGTERPRGPRERGGNGRRGMRRRAPKGSTCRSCLQGGGGAYPLWIKTMICLDFPQNLRTCFTRKSTETSCITMKGYTWKRGSWNTLFRELLALSGRSICQMVHHALWSSRASVHGYTGIGMTGCAQQ